MDNFVSKIRRRLKGISSDRYNRIAYTKNLMGAIRVLVVSILLLSHVHFIYSTSTSLPNQNIIELAEQGESEMEEEMDDEDHIPTFFDVDFLLPTNGLFAMQLIHAFKEQFLVILSPPPELV